MTIGHENRRVWLSPSIRTSCFSVLLCASLVSTSGCLFSAVHWKAAEVAGPIRSTGPSLCGDPIDVETLYAHALALESDDRSSCVELFYEVAVGTAPGCTAVASPRRQELHRSALIRLVEAGQKFARLDPRCGLTMGDPGFERQVPIRHRGFVWSSDQFCRLTPIGAYKAKAIRNTYCRGGVGLPVVVSSPGADDDGAAPMRAQFAATLCLVSDQMGIEDANLLTGTDHFYLELVDPLRVDSVASCGNVLPIAKEITAPLAYGLQGEGLIYLRNFINADSSRGATRLYSLEPHQPGKIPVVLIHGLLSDPSAWVSLVNDLRAQPGFVDRFQIWVFEYPTGQPFLTSAAELRQRLDQRVQRLDPGHQDPQLRDMVLVGHSMGGLIAKLQVTSSGDALWNAFANLPIEQVVMTDAIRQRLTESFFFQPSPHVSEVVFLATPNRGSLTAQRLCGRIGSWMVNVPQQRQQEYAELMRRNPDVFVSRLRQRVPTSIDLLEPSDPLLLAIGRLPFGCGVRAHSVIGDHCWSPCFGRSDGVVPVSSAREPYAISERMIRATHSEVKSHPETVAEVLRILNEHASTPSLPLIQQAVGRADGGTGRVSDRGPRRSEPPIRHAVLERTEMEIP
ncbi:alpha/beta fold hydrolase [Roseiconus nitratireducens]|uniref:Alpha/beta fold hydrolase n=1 Tax=Roseiconus nitratireducens TaxID=2605748 RepID=A0A5M6CWI9_9BACT|nr:alpha/beta fold hydrolase [Roseiconus nitratireducens]KAA5539588.1 alpha/beta fold hydrolase [Roseiconus nitratireducens]